MTNNKNTDGITLGQSALIAGLGLLFMTFAAIFAQVAVNSNFITGNASETAIKILAANNMFRFGIVSYLIVVALDIIVAWALYAFFKPVNKSLSLLTCLLRVIYAAIFGGSLVFLVNGLGLLNNPDQLEASINSFLNCWNLALFFFGIHLGLLGYLVWKSNYAPKIIGVLLFIASFGYLIDSIGKILITNYSISLTLFTFIGEIILLFWLIFSGRKTKANTN